MLDVVLNDILFDALSSFTAFFITFDITIHFRLKAYEFGDRNATSLVFEFSDDLLIGIAMVW